MLVKNLFFLIIAGALFCGYTLLQEKPKLSGEDLYRNCSGCHLADGKGVEGFYPPHIKHVPDLIKAKDGRKYLINVVLYGLKGKICVEGKAYDKAIAMPAWDKVLKDDQVARLLNYVAINLGNNKKYLPKNFKPFTTSEIKAVRKVKLTDEQVYKMRTKLYGKPCP